MRIQPTINKLFFSNPKTKASKIRTEILDRMEDEGCKIYREKVVSCTSRVILGYKNQYSKLANCSARVSANGSYEYKYSDTAYSPIPSSLKIFTSRRFKVDKNGNADVEMRRFTTQDGKVKENYTKSTHYDNV